MKYRYCNVSYCTCKIQYKNYHCLDLFELKSANYVAIFVILSITENVIQLKVIYIFSTQLHQI